MSEFRCTGSVPAEMLNLTSKQIMLLAILGKRALLEIVDETDSYDITQAMASEAERVGLVDLDFAPTFVH